MPGGLIGPAAPPLPGERPPGRTKLALRRRDLLVPLAITISLHFALLTAQTTAAALTGSLAVGANALHVAVDTAVHLVALGGIWFATRPPDPRHPYGYERYEALASLLIGILLLAVMALIVLEALPRLIAPSPARAPGIALVTMAGSGVCSGALAVYLRRRGQRLDSLVLRSEAVHAAADTLTALAVLVAVGAGSIGISVLDPIAAIGIAGLIAWRGLGRRPGCGGRFD